MHPMTMAAHSPTATSPLAAGARADRFKRVLPNALTVLRVVLAGAFFVLLTVWHGSETLNGGRRPAGSGAELTLLSAAIIFVVAALTDALDGWLSRKWSVTSVFGRVMDPFADKVLIIGAFVFLAGPAFCVAEHRGWLQVSGVRPWMVVVVLARELLVTSIRGVVEGRGGNFQASFSGKAKMIVQAVAVPTVLSAIAIFDVSRGTPGRALIDGVVWTAVVVTALSGVPYMVRGARALRDAEPAP